MSRQTQTQVQTQVQVDPINIDTLHAFLQTRLNETQYLEDAYYVYLKKPSRSYWEDLEALLNKPEIFYWYAFTFAGHNKLYNLVWGTFVDGEVTIESGCTYRLNSKARLDILNKVNSLRKTDNYFYLGGGVRDRYSETMSKYVKPSDMEYLNAVSTVSGVSTVSTVSTVSNVNSNEFQLKPDKNRRDLQKDLEKALGLPKSLLKFILDKIIETLEYSKLSLEAVPKTCPELNDCSSAKEISDPNCEVYYYGTECYLNPKDRDYKDCQNSPALT